MRQCSVLPSPTPIIPIVDEDIIVIPADGNALLSKRADIKPAVPEPTIPIDNFLMRTTLPLSVSCHLVQDALYAYMENLLGTIQRPQLRA